MRRGFVPFLLTVGLHLGAAEPSPSDFQLDARLEIRLWAAEPDVIDPVSLAFDESGRAYVAECRDYPYGTGPDGKVGSTIRLLEDRDADGRVDRSVVFARNLSYATSVTPWRGGILVAAAPDILFLKDTDGDGVADVREVVLTGFLRGVSDSLVNGLRFGPDNRIHGANGGNGGRLRAGRGGAALLDLGENDFAFDPDTGQVERTGRTGGGFGLVFDAWGRAFTTYNIDHIQHRFLDYADYADRPGFPDGPTTASISDHGEMARIFPISTAVTRPNHPEQSGHFSAAGGMGFLGAHDWPEDLRDSVMVCDVVGNLVHRDVIHSAGAGFTARRAAGEQDHEFIANRDPASRPVGLECGPDGALYLLDMHRNVIEHPDYIPAKLRARQDVRAGADRGRIWRITPKGSPRLDRARPDTGQDAVLVGLLGHGDQWWRITAQRLLVERQSRQVAPALRRRLSSTGTPAANPLERVHVLWTLDGLHELTAADLRIALADPAEGVRAAALKLTRLGQPTLSALAPQVRSLTSDPSARVRFRAALALRSAPGAETVRSLSELIHRDSGDPWIRRAVLASIEGPGKARLLASVLSDRDFASRPAAELALGELAESFAADPATQSDSFPEVMSLIRPESARELRLALIRGLSRGGERREEKPRWTDPMNQACARLAIAAEDEELAEVWKLGALGGSPGIDPNRLATARFRASDATLKPEARAQSIALLAFDETADSTLVQLMDGREPAEVALAAFQQIRLRPAPAVGSNLVARWRTFGPALRPRMLGLLLERRNFHEPLVAALESGRVTVGELNLDLEQRRRLLRSGAKAIAQRASKFFGDEEYSNRRRVVDEWMMKLPAEGQASRGRGIFTESCAGCHRCAEIGQRVGPDLAGAAHRSVEDLLGNILDPNMAINPGFVTYQVETRDGDTHTGLLAVDAVDSVTLVQAAGQKAVIPRREVKRMESTGHSLMPEGLESGRTPQDLRDLIEFIQSAR